MKNTNLALSFAQIISMRSGTIGWRRERGIKQIN